MKQLLLFSLALAVQSIFAQNKSIILGRPSDVAITASVLFDQKVEFYLEYGTNKGIYPLRTNTISNIANQPNKVELTALLPNTKYFYRLRHRLLSASSFVFSPEYTFQTQRAPGNSFKFVVEADEHLYDKKGVRNLYKIALDNEAKDSADFMLSLGDTFGDDHTPNTTTSADMNDLHKDYLQYLGAVCHSMPFFFCLGNHEGENGYYLKQNAPNNIAVYGTQWRKYYYANPYPNGFYTGNLTKEAYGIDQPENYYAWTWGDALFVVLDVYRDCDVNDKPQNWDWTLGKTQYDWLKTTLETSKSKYKFVFAHHTRGQGRGAVNTAKGFEWGGYGSKGTWEFNTMRPGWAMPIHQLMVTTGVNIFFQGHDHLYAKEQLDGLVYQEVPMPSDSTYEIGVLANADAYTDVTLDGSGHIRVSVTPTCVTVDYVRAYLPKDTLNGKHRNREVAFSYTVGACAKTTPVQEISADQGFNVFPNPAKDLLNVQAKNAFSFDQKIDLLNLQGQVLQSQILTKGSTMVQFGLQQVPPGVYVVRIPGANQVHAMKVVVSK